MIAAHGAERNFRPSSGAMEDQRSGGAATAGSAGGIGALRTQGYGAQQ